MDREELQRIAAGPLSDANKLFLPEGRKAGKRPAKIVYEGTALGEPVPLEKVRKMKEDAHGKEFSAILDYYATTTVPFERIASHTGLTVERVAESMIYRGRGEG